MVLISRHSGTYSWFKMQLHAFRLGRDKEIMSLLFWPLFTVSVRIQIKILVLVLKSLHGLRVRVWVTHQMILNVPGCRRKTRGDRAFAPNMWTSLPLNIRAAQSIEDLKSLLKTQLFTLAFNTNWVWHFAFLFMLLFICVFIVSYSYHYFILFLACAALW